MKEPDAPPGLRYARRDAMPNLFFASHSRKFMFLSVSKNACTSLKHMLYRIEFGREFVAPSAFGAIHCFWGFSERSDPGALIDRRNVEALGRYPDYLRFAVYRDPVDRFLSLYHNMVIWPLGSHPFYTRHRLEGMALDPFLDVVEQILQIPDPLAIDEHLRPQSRCYTREDVDYIVPIFRLAGFLAGKFGVTLGARQNTHTGPRVVPTQRQVERIRLLYREDYEIVPNHPEAELSARD